ncbi:unnamed protein product [Camellia sinensis]
MLEAPKILPKILPNVSHGCGTHMGPTLCGSHTHVRHLVKLLVEYLGLTPTESGVFFESERNQSMCIYV